MYPGESKTALDSIPRDFTDRGSLAECRSVLHVLQKS